MNRRSRRTGKAQDRGLFLFAQPQHRQRSGTRHRHPAQLAPVNQAPAAGQKGQLQGLSFLQAWNIPGKSPQAAQGRTEAAARGDPGGNWHPLQLVPGEPGRHPAQLIPRSGAERRLAGAFPAQGRNTRGAAAGGSRPHRGSGRGIDGAAAGTRNRAQLQTILNRQRAFLFTGTRNRQRSGRGAAGTPENGRGGAEICLDSR